MPPGAKEQGRTPCLRPKAYWKQGDLLEYYHAADFGEASAGADLFPGTVRWPHLRTLQLVLIPWKPEIRTF
jgi:hypothetical protein